MILIRRIHLYSGLMLLPWVLLYGVTGAMFNHQELFPEPTIQAVPASVLDNSPMTKFPSPQQFAEQVVKSLQAASNGATITLVDDHRAEFTNNMMFELHESGNRYVVHIDPVSRASKVFNIPHNEEQPEALLKNVHNISLSPNPLEAARSSVASVLKAADVDTQQNPHPFGWTKLNFLASVNGEPARVTYVLKDGHVDVTRFEGQDGMTPRHFLLRLHTSHGQSPHWNGRSIWSLFVDAMAIAMVTWALSGLLMWWQIKRTRLIGAGLIAISLIMAAVMYLQMHDYYATTKL
jgi:hypothetical protein